MSEESKKDWERPWTTEEIVQHADNWNLACDAALLNTLKAFGDRILKKAEDVNEKIENLNKNLSKIHLQVDLARNEFSSLRNTQFVECRVYEDDETILPEKPQEETNVPEEETIEDFREVVGLGLEILDEFYDKVNVTVSDSEGEDEEIPSYVYRRKDPYIDRRLPLVIGTEEWHKKWHVGLVETDSENENSSEKLSDSEDEDDLSQNKDHSDVSSELSNFSGLNNSKVKPLVVPSTNRKQDNLASSSGSETSIEPAPKNLSFAEQLAAKLGNVIKETGAILEEPEVNRRPIQKKTSDFGALFSNEPPPLDDDVRKKESHGIFSGGKGLFDDDEDDDLWNSGKTTTSAKQGSTSERKIEEYNKLDQGKGLFDDDSDDGIFGSTSSYGTTQQNKPPYLQSNKPAVPVFDEEPPLFDEVPNTKEKKKPTGGVSIFGKSDILHGQNIGKILRKVSSSDDSNEDDPNLNVKPSSQKSSTTDVISTINKDKSENNQNKSSKNQTISSVPQKDKQEKKNTLFDDDLVPQKKEKQEKKTALFDDDLFSDDLFSNSTKRGSSGLFEKSILFSDEDTDEPFLSRKSSLNENTLKIGIEPESSKHLRGTDVLSPETPDTEYSFRKNSKSNISVLFDDSRNDDDNILVAKEDKKTTKKKEYIEKENSTTSTKLKQNLFEDDLEDVDDLFDGVSKKKDDTKTKQPKGFLFDNDVDDFDIFMTKSDKNLEKQKTSTKTKEISGKNKTNKSTKPKISLFDDDLDNMDDLFSQLSKKDDTYENLFGNTSKVEDSSSKTATILNKQTGNSHDKTNSVIKEHEKELKENKTEQKVINKTEAEAKSEVMEKSETLEKTVIKSTSKEKHKIEEKIDKSDISDTIRTSVEDQKQVEIVEVTAAKNVAIDSSKTPAEDKSAAENVKEIDTTIKKEITTRQVKIEEVKGSTNQEHSKENVVNIPKISIFEEPEKVDIFENTPADTGPSEIKTEKYKNSPNVMNFMDSIPPPDEDWDTYSDNTYDDMEPGNDGFQSQPSSLFDSEPPSFFNDANDIPEDFIEKRFSSVPTPSQEIPEDIFNTNFSTSDDRQRKISTNNPDEKSNKNINVITNVESLVTPNSNKNLEENLFSNDDVPWKDDLFITSENSSETREKRKDEKPKLSQKPKLKTEEDTLHTDLEDKTETKPSTIDHTINENKRETSEKTIITPESTTKNLDSLFDNVPDLDQTDFIVSKEKPTNYDNENFEISKNIISDKISKKSVSFDNVDENKIRTDEPAGSDSDDDMQSNISKITEKLQQISNKNEERTKPLVIPRKLSHNLNINVGALIPGSALPKREKSQSPDEQEQLSKSLPASRFNLNEEFVRTRKTTIGRVSSEDTPTTKDYTLEKSVSFDGGTDVEVLQSITKDRVRIPVKRRPSSRRARQKSLRDSISDFRLDDAVFDEESPLKNNDSIDNSLSHDQKPIVSIEVQKTKEKNNVSTKTSDDTSKEINVLEDESEDLFKTIEKDIKNVNKADIVNTKNKELFDDENEELFGEISSKLTGQMDDLFKDDLFENIKEKHVKSESQDEVKKVPSDYNKNKPVVTNNLETTKKVDNDFLQDFKNIPDTKKKSNLGDLFDSSDEDIFKSTKLKARETKTEKVLKQKQDSAISIIGRIADKTEEKQSHATGKSKPDSLFDFSDDDDFLENFTNKKKDEKTREKTAYEKPKTNSLFEDMDDDDIFGTSSTENKTKQDLKPSVINKKPPKSTSLRKLENIEGDDDPLSALLK